MTVSHKATSTFIGGTTGVTVPPPVSGYAAGDMMLLTVAWGNANNTSPTIVDGTWALLGHYVGGPGAWGLDTGPRGMSVWWKICTATPEASVVVTQNGTGTTARTMTGFMNAWGKTEAAWATPTAGGGTDTTSGTAYAVTSDSNLGLAVVGDMLVCANSWAPDTATIGATGTPTWTGTGGTSNIDTASVVASGQGNDHRHTVVFKPIESGPASGFPSFTATLSVAGGGATMFVRLRDEALPPEEHAGGSVSNVEASAAGAGFKRANDGSVVAAEADASGSGSKAAAGGSIAEAVVSGTGTGTKSTDGGSTAEAITSGTGTGHKVGSGGSTTEAIASSAGTGHKQARGGSSCSAVGSAAGAGHRSASSGSACAAVASASGTGHKIGRGGSACTVHGYGTGTGHPVLPGVGGSVCIAHASGTGTGVKHARGGSVAATEGSGVGSGRKTNAGGSTCSITGSATGTGASRRFGGSVCLVLVTAHGTGGPPFIRDVTVRAVLWRQRSVTFTERPTVVTLTPRTRSVVITER